MILFPYSNTEGLITEFLWFDTLYLCVPVCSRLRSIGVNILIARKRESLGASRNVCDRVIRGGWGTFLQPTTIHDNPVTSISTSLCFFGLIHDFSKVLTLRNWEPGFRRWRRPSIKSPLLFFLSPTFCGIFIKRREMINRDIIGSRNLRDLSLWVSLLSTNVLTTFLLRRTPRRSSRRSRNLQGPETDVPLTPTPESL